MPETRFDYIRYDTPQWEDVHVSLFATKRAGVKDPTFEQFKNDGGSSVGTYAFAFAANRPEELFFCAELPHSWIPGTSIKPHIHWSPSTDSAGVARFGLEYNLIDTESGTFSTTATVYATASAAGAYASQCVYFATMAATGLAVSAMMLGRIFRTPTNAADTYPAKLYMHSLNLHFQVNRIGTLGEFGD